MPLSYEYAIGSVRAREKNLFSRADAEAMLAFKELSALEGFLKDKGYPDGAGIDDILKQSIQDTMRYLESIVPDMGIFDALLYVNDVHNIKSVIKGLLADTDYQRLLVEPCTVPAQEIETAVKENKYDRLPERFSAAAQKAYEVLAHTADARLADAYLDSACMKAQLEKAEETKIPFLLDYLKTDVFYRNVKILLRGAETGAPKSYYEVALYDAGLYDRRALTEAAVNGIDAVADYLSAKDIFRSAEAMERFRSNPAELERFSDNLLMSLAVDKCKRSGTGAEAAIGYYLAMQAQSKAVHMIAAGILTEAGAQTTRERLRELYGV